MKLTFKDAKEHAEFIRMDGLPNIVTAHHLLLRIMWGVLLLGNAGLCCWLIVTTIKEFYAREVITTIRLEHELSSTFPTVTFCNSNPFTSDYAASIFKEANITLNEKDNNYLEIFGKLQAYYLYSKETVLTHDELQKMGPVRNLIDEFRFKSVYYNETMLQYMFHPLYINCYRFNAGGNLSADTVDVKTTVIFQVDTQLNESFHVQPANPGVHVILQNKTDNPYSNLQPAYKVTPGVGNGFIALRSFSNKYQSPYSGCTVLEENKLSESLTDRSLFDKLTKEEYAYTQADCISLCKANYMKEECGCSLSAIANMLVSYHFNIFEDCFEYFRFL